MPFSLNWVNSSKLIPIELEEGYYTIKTDMKTNYLYEQKVLPEIGTMIKETSPYMHTFLPIKPS